MSLLRGVSAKSLPLGERIQDGFANMSGTTRSDVMGMAGGWLGSLSPLVVSRPLGSRSPPAIIFLFFLIIFLYVVTGFLQHCVGPSMPQGSLDPERERDRLLKERRQRLRDYPHITLVRPLATNTLHVRYTPSSLPRPPKSHVGPEARGPGSYHVGQAPVR